MALKVHKITETGDIELDSLSQPIDLYGQEAAEQLIKSAISLWQGNWFVDLDRGVPWLRILKKLYSKSEIVSVFTQAILKISIVDEVLDLFIKVGDENDSSKRRVAYMTYLIIADGEQVKGQIEL